MTTLVLASLSIVALIAVALFTWAWLRKGTEGDPFVGYDEWIRATRERIGTSERRVRVDWMTTVDVGGDQLEKWAERAVSEGVLRHAGDGYVKRARLPLTAPQLETDSDRADEALGQPTG